MPTFATRFKPLAAPAEQQELGRALLQARFAPDFAKVCRWMLTDPGTVHADRNTCLSRDVDVALSSQGQMAVACRYRTVSSIPPLWRTTAVQVARKPRIPGWSVVGAGCCISNWNRGKMTPPHVRLQNQEAPNPKKRWTAPFSRDLF